MTSLTVPGGHPAQTPGGQPLAITYVAVSELRPDPRNPRKHSTRQLKQLDRSVGAFGFVTPILIDARNTIIAGHARHEVARRLGLATVPVVRLQHLSPAQARALAVADNRLTDLSIWDERLLGELFAELATFELDFDLEATGFSLPEIDLKIEALTVASSGGEDLALIRLRPDRCAMPRMWRSALGWNRPRRRL
jgi:ParB-like chromosome segregation protein Spo0J